MSTPLLIGSAVIALWGLGHLLATRGVVAGFGALSPDNARIITMEWLAEGLTLIFLGALVALIALAPHPDEPAARLVVLAVAAMLLLLAGLSAATGARTSILPMRLCPVVKTAVALLFLFAVLGA